jgi:transcriptional regulator with XRE-family HTH domain
MHMAVATNIRTYRLPRKLTQAALAARVGKQRVTITRYELGGVDIPVSVLGEIAKALKVPVRKLLEPNGKHDAAQP